MHTRGTSSTKLSKSVSGSTSNFEGVREKGGVQYGMKKGRGCHGNWENHKEGSCLYGNSQVAQEDFLSLVLQE